MDSFLQNSSIHFQSVVYTFSLFLSLSLSLSVSPIRVLFSE